MSQGLRRRIIASPTGLVHLWTGGQGPAVILIHGSPGNAWLVKPIAERLARHFCVYAIDTPGFGGSDALPGPIDGVASLADGYLGILDSIGLPNTLIYGTHSGAAIGLELARRHPARVSGFVLEGVPAFTLEEQQPLLDPVYLTSFAPDLLGGHYTRAWTRFHDQFVWFPWYQREPSHLNEAPAGSAADIHLWVEMYFQALRHDYQPTYRAVIGYGRGALEAAGEVRMPGVFMAERSDMLFPHLERLPPLGAGQRIERVTEPAAVPERIEAALRSLPRAAPGVLLEAFSAASKIGFHDFAGGELKLRSRAQGRGTPVLLLHDAPGAGRQLTDLYEALAVHSPVLLPDLPGCGDSDALDAGATLADHADLLATVVSMRIGGAAHVHAVGMGAALALELNARHPQLVAGMTLTGLLRLRGDERRDMIGRLAPPIVLAEDGSHWYRTWLMLRDSLVRWPWYRREPQALRRQEIVLDADELHAWTCDVMRQCETYHRLIDAVLSWDPDAAIAAARGKVTVGIDAHHALHASDVAWAASGRKAVTLPLAVAERARMLASLCAAAPSE